MTTITQAMKSTAAKQVMQMLPKAAALDMTPVALAAHRISIPKQQPITAQVQTISQRNAYKDYVRADGDASSYLITWPSKAGKDAKVTKRFMNTLDNLSRNYDNDSQSVVVTSPFFVLDGKGGSMASMCVVTPKTPDNEDAATEVFSDSRSPESWINAYCASRR
eukprot:Nitzschia sp. Nitz4//scaffold178_size73299//2768//3259//NITZ4_005689-RA/size73299-processed-gene-0.20-mRNA-1//-1//CDS//3329539092//5551//frame0